MFFFLKITLIQALRQRYVQVISLMLLLIFVLVSWNGTRVHKMRNAAYTEATLTMRNAWSTQGAVNPHNSAHYGHIVFQPVTAMQVLDNGVQPYAGGMLRLEAHKQNEPAFSAAQQRTELSRFGDFSLAWVLQVLMPLFIILLGFNIVSADFENDTIKLIAAQGPHPFQYLLGKALSILLIALILLYAGVTIQYVIYYAAGSGVPMEAAHLVSWLGTYTLYVIVISVLSVALSAALKNSTASLSMQLAGWILWMIIMPRVTANLGANMYPVEHRLAFNTTLAEDRKKGIDGHNPADQRIKAFEDSLLTHYKVSKLDSLPVNADGLIMQADENYSNLVYDNHFTRIRNTLDNQNKVSRYGALLNPFLAARNLSMGIAQSDYKHYLQLVYDAEQYRRYLVQTLNEKMAYGGSKAGEWDWAPDSTWYASLPDFVYQKPTLKTTLYWYSTEWLSLCLWVCLATAWLLWIGRNLFRF